MPFNAADLPCRQTMMGIDGRGKAVAGWIAAGDRSVGSQMKTRGKVFVLGIAIVLLPVLFCFAMRREVAGSITVLTLRGTDVRAYRSDSGDFAIARRTQDRRLEDPDWVVTRKRKAAWILLNAGALYLEFPFLVADVLNRKK